MPSFGARQRRVVIRIMGQRLVADAGSLVQEVEHLRGFLYVRIEQRIGYGVRGNGLPQILAYFLEAVLRACLPGVAVASDPYAAAGSGAGAAELRGLINDEHVLDAHLIGAQGGRKPAIARTDN